MAAIKTGIRFSHAFGTLAWGGFAYANGFTAFEFGVGLIGTSLIYLLVCVNDYLHLIGERLEQMERFTERRLEKQHRMLRILCVDVRLLQRRVGWHITNEVRRHNPDISLSEAMEIVEKFEQTSQQEVCRDISGDAPDRESQTPVSPD